MRARVRTGQDGAAARDRGAPGHGREGVPGHGERSRSQLLLKLAGAENMLILAVNDLAVNGALHHLYGVKKCVIH